MFKLTISGIVEAKYWMPTHTKAIGMVDPDTEALFPVIPYHVEKFHDISSDRIGYLSPKIEHVRNILNFSKNFKEDDKILVHCHAGVSRSTAISILILIQHGMSIEDAFNHVYKIRDCMDPNRMILAYGDHLLGCNGKLIQYVNDVWPKLHFVYRFE